MRLEVVRALSEWLANTTYGVAVQLGTLPVDTGDTAPLVTLVVDGTKDNALAKGEQVARGTDVLVLVTPDGPTITEPGHTKSEYAVGRTPIALTVVHRGAGEAAKKVQDVEYVCRALVLSVKAYFEQNQTARTRNEVTVLSTSQVQYGLTVDEGLGALAAVVFTVLAFDKRAQRLT